MFLRKIISGGQTGADRAALDWAINRGIPHGGWCPRGRKAEDGTIDRRYNLVETPSDDYSQRTEWNVRDSDATAVFSILRELRGGSLLTVKLAEKYNKPVIHLCKEDEQANHAQELRSFIEKYKISVLNVAGPRESDESGAYQFVSRILDQALGAAWRPDN
ncbi:MAG TPA: putative molybdenum carrier protein [Blastocatellia bacterium]|nr:putative molybdenum carrier protein [Blastocatellia bacterium]